MIKKEFQKLHQFLEDEEAARLKALQTEVEQKSTVMKDRIAKMATEIISLSDTISAIEDHMEAEDTTFLLVRLTAN